MKQKLAFAVLMGIVTTGTISFVLVSVNIGYGARFLFIWMRSWGIAYLVALPMVLFVAPRIDRFVKKYIKES